MCLHAKINWWIFTGQRPAAPGVIGQDGSSRACMCLKCSVVKIVSYPSGSLLTHTYLDHLEDTDALDHATERFRDVHSIPIFISAKHIRLTFRSCPTHQENSGLFRYQYFIEGIFRQICEFVWFWLRFSLTSIAMLWLKIITKRFILFSRATPRAVISIFDSPHSMEAELWRIFPLWLSDQTSAFARFWQLGVSYEREAHCFSYPGVVNKLSTSMIRSAIVKVR